jgi:hypothetical protein
MYPPLMSLVDWYLHKANQCARLAQGTTDRRQLARLEDEGKLWLQMAQQAENGEAREARGANPKVDAARFN